MMTPMKRTTVFLPEELHERLREEAFRNRTSMAELIRSRLERTNGRRKRRALASDPLAEVEGIVHDGKLSAGIDEALYGN
jgi:Arc/MetJ-type ribon-helix-helix transcriptional regulator